MKVKICGMTNIEDAAAAAESGADMLGFIFVERSPRFIDPVSAKKIIHDLPPKIETVGVFADTPEESILKVLRETGIGKLQLHGKETPYECARYPVPVIKSFRIGSDFDPNILRQYSVSAFLLDTYTEGLLGGTGKTFDWKKAVEAKSFGPIILAGGLNPENIIAAIRTVRPYAVDVNSGVESAPGKKDRQKINKLFQALRELEKEQI
jgi:phosphoribosylanthranilate isomerase